MRNTDQSKALVIALGALVLATASVQAQSFQITTPPSDLKLKPFYQKYVSANGYPIVSSVKVDDYALKEATGSLQRKAIYFHYPNYAFHKQNRLGSAIREGDFKLITRYDDSSFELYNLANDISEKQDLAKSSPEIAMAMKAKLDAWLAASGARMPGRISGTN